MTEVGDGRPTPALTFSEVSHTQLEELISQLPAGVEGVLNVQRRLQALLQANAVVADDLSLPAVLHNVVTAACELVQARHGVLGMVGPDGGLGQTVHADVLPAGSGGSSGLSVTDNAQALDDFPAPVRLSTLNAPPAAGESVTDHPTTGDFLGVPIRVRGVVFGNLYLTDSANGQFTAEDEQLVTAVAATAGVAIAHAKLHEETLQQRTWLSASTELAQTLFAGTAGPPLDLLLGFAVRGAAADMAMFAVPISDDRAWVQAAAGALAEMAGTVVNVDRTFVGRVIRTGTPILFSRDDISEGAHNSDDLSAGVGGVLGVPLLGTDSDGVVGALIVARSPGGPAFTENDRDQLAAFVGHAGIALQLETARGEHEALLRVEDHERIAADLHDHVIQELFATGMGLQGMLGGIYRLDQRTRINGYIDALDATIGRIRSTIFQIQIEPEKHRTLTTQILAVLEEQATDPGLTTAVEFHGPLDLGLPPGLIDDILAVTRESLSNIARHAGASTVRLGIRLAEGVLSIDVTDNGTGVADPLRGTGLSNLLRRAETHGGAMTIDTPPGGGTHLRWTARLHKSG